MGARVPPTNVAGTLALIRAAITAEQGSVAPRNQKGTGRVRRG
jgi:hypothetical protein